MTHMSPSDRDEALAQLTSIRQSIDNIDAAVIHLLAERFKFTQEVGQLKAEQSMPPADPAREKRQIQRLRELAEASRLDPEFAEKFLNFIVAEVIHHHVAAAQNDQSNQNEQSDQGGQDAQGGQGAQGD